MCKEFLGHAAESMTELYLDRRKDQADLTQLLEAIYDPQDEQDAHVQEPEQAQVPPEEGGQVVSLAGWRQRHTG